MVKITTPLSSTEKGMTEYEMAGWHYRLNGHESEQTPGDSLSIPWETVKDRDA